MTPVALNAPARSMPMALRTWRWLILALGVLTAVYFVFCLVSAIQFRTTPFLGVMFTHTGVVSAALPTSDIPWTGIDIGLQRDDIIVGVNSAAIAPDNNFSFDILRTSLSNALAGFPVRVDFLRSATSPNVNISYCDTPTSALVSCSLLVDTMSFPDGDMLAYFIVPFISGLVTFLIGWVVFYLRNDTAEGLIIVAAAFLSAIFMAGLFEIGSTSVTTWAWLVASCLLGGTLVTLGMTYPRRLRLLWQAPLIEGLPLLVSGFAAAGLVVSHLNPAAPTNDNQVQLAITFVIICLMLLAALMMSIQRVTASTLAARRQIDIVLIGLGLLLIPGILWFVYQAVVASLPSVFTISFESLTPLFIFPNAAFAFALLQFRRVNTERVISQSITYGIMLTALLTGTFLLSLGASLIALDLFNASGFVGISLILFVMVILFTPVRTRLQDRIDQIYFRTRRNYQEKIESFSQALVTRGRYSDIVTEYRRLLNENISPTSIFVFVRARESGDFESYNQDTEIHFSENSALVSALQAAREALVFPPTAQLPLALYTEQGRLGLLGAHAIAPMHTTDQLIGFVIVGHPRANKSTYSYEEVRFLSLLTNQLAIGTDRTQVIGSLEQRVRELDVLSQVGQAVNFTLEFDDILELINAQTSKLVDAPCFYIALYDENQDQLSFAFFLEQDDRQSDKENVRWYLDNGLFSEVVRASKPIRIENYAQEMQRRGATAHFEMPTLKAWMGVPLSAGRRNLGVLAVGKTRNGDVFSDEQFKIFSDIGALAATSLDKARLFGETRIRERQLTVLNDISRQLVATESDVEKLLEIIMVSAVDILECEAGALLLTAEDDSTHLEFRVVIGGAENLLGTRIDAHKGIAGEVVKTGKPLIANDTGQSKSNQQVSEYKTQSLLAVPLIAKNDVIGVLEVLNKKDGTGFIQENADLLTTFAGQAAIAIENARLFRMTDLQLAQRVKELEALERIDNDLNRTLDVSEVANITVRSALQTLGAHAGALGIVHDSPAYLEIVGIEGYAPHEYPGSSVDLNWRLDTGIVSRVMRSREPDLAVDLSVDPSYDGNLAGAVSQITLPMFSGDEINAILILEKNQLPRFTLSDWAFAQRLAEHASIAIANAQLYAALTEANKSKSEFMGFAAHELKNPLTSVIGFADLLRQGMTGQLTDQQVGLVNIIHSNANRMQTIIGDLRDSARMDANEFSVELSPMNVRHAVIETLRPFVQFMHDKNQELVNLVSDDLPLILGDENRLIQVLTNLVSNAHKYSPSNTTITILASILTDYVDHEGKRREPMLRISVQDQGLGISEEDQKRLFRERYFRSTNRLALEQPGTGLGMTLTFGIVQKHRGDIWVESELGKGSTFHVAIPLAPQSMQTRIGELASD